jgi:hypothetical protein
MATRESTTGALPESPLTLVDALTDRLGKAKAITTMMGRKPSEAENLEQAEIASMAVADLLEDAGRIGQRLFELARDSKVEVAA